MNQVPTLKKASPSLNPNSSHSRLQARRLLTFWNSSATNFSFIWAVRHLRFHTPEDVIPRGWIRHILCPIASQELCHFFSLELTPNHIWHGRSTIPSPTVIIVIEHHLSLRLFFSLCRSFNAPRFPLLESTRIPCPQSSVLAPPSNLAPILPTPHPGSACAYLPIDPWFDHSWGKKGIPWLRSWAWGRTRLRKHCWWRKWMMQMKWMKRKLRSGWMMRKNYESVACESLQRWKWVDSRGISYGKWSSKEWKLTM